PESWWVSVVLKAIRAVALVLDVITFPVHLIVQRPWRKRALSRRIKARIIESTPNSITVESVSGPCELHLRLVRDGVTSMESMLRAAAARWGERACLGTRTFNMGDYVWRSYNQVEREASHFGAGLRELGCAVRQNVVMFAETLVTIYATLGDEAIAHGINETEVSTVITSHDLLPKFKKILANTPRVDTIIFMEDQLKSTDRDGFKHGIRIVGYKEGVVLSHRNMLATLKSFTDAMPIYDTDVLMGFLPLAHVFELLAENMCLFGGVAIGYSTPLTMLDSSSKIMKGTEGDASVLKPTCITTVPLIMDRISKGITDKVSRQGAFASAFFKWAYTKIRALLGGRVRMMISGGAPLSPDTHAQVRICLCCDVVAGYGLTETTSSATVMDVFDRSTGRVGAPTTNSQLKLIDWEEGNYRVSNKPFPQGEVMIGGDCVAEGYYRMPEKTREEFVDEGGRRWFRSGDIAELHHDGCIKIIDRKKDLVKLQAGEYVSLGKVEAELKTCALVENICVYGDSSKNYTVALVVPHPQRLAELAARLALPPPHDFAALCRSEAVEKAVVKELADHARKCGLERFEVPAAVKLCTEVWSPDMGLVTAAFKIKRKDIQERYKEDIKRMYAS
ncbi:Acyl-CoA synthetase, partial [Operophtera brumata]